MTFSPRPRPSRRRGGVAEEEELLKYLFGVVNVWRLIRGPVLDLPLPRCDARTFTNDELIASDLVCAHVRGETSRVREPAYAGHSAIGEHQGAYASLVFFPQIPDLSQDGCASNAVACGGSNPAQVPSFIPKCAPEMIERVTFSFGAI